MMEKIKNKWIKISLIVGITFIFINSSVISMVIVNDKTIIERMQIYENYSYDYFNRNHLSELSSPSSGLCCKKTSPACRFFSLRMA